ncbi:hypothetical protein AAMO2058_001361500 [Amorphochlora amoebiformis]
MASYRRKPQDVTCCARCCRWIQGKLLLLVNLIDFIGGVGLVGFGLYVYIKNFAPEYVYLPLIIIGLFILSTTFFSTCGAYNYKGCCGCFLYPLSAMMGILVCLAEIACAGLLAAYRKRYSEWLDKHHNEYNISDSEAEQLEHGTMAVIVGFFILALLEVLRFCVSRGFKKGKREDDEQKRMLSDYEEREYRQIKNQRSMERAEKHAKLRAYYAEKYKL